MVLFLKSVSQNHNCESSSRMNTILKSKLREYSKVLSDLVSHGATDEELEAQILEQMVVIYRIIGICLGIPSKTITWEFMIKQRIIIALDLFHQ